MAGYSSDEITAAVSSLVKSTVTTKRDALGPVDVKAKFDEVIELVSSTLIFDPNAIFYLLYLVTNRLNVSVQQAIGYVSDLETAISEMAKTTQPITKTSLLGDAAAALTEVDAVLSTDSSIKQSAYDRFVTSVDAFRDASLKPNIVQGGVIVRPPQEATSAAVSDLNSIRAAYPDLLSKAKDLLHFVDAFMSLRLPTLSAEKTVQQTRVNLEALQSVFDSPDTTDDYKIAQARSAYLQLAAGKAVLGSIRTVSDPRLPRVDARTGSGLSGVAVLASAPGKLTPANVACSISGPWKIYDANNILTISEDSNPPTSYTLSSAGRPIVTSNGYQTSYNFHDAATAVLMGTNTGPFVVPDSPGNVFRLIVDNIVFDVPLTSGSRTTDQVVTELQAFSGLTAVLAISNSAGRLRFETVGIGSTHGIIVRTLGSVFGFTGTGAYAPGADLNRLFYVDGWSVILTAGMRTVDQIAADINTWAATNSRPYHAAVNVDGKSIDLTRTDGYHAMYLNAPDVGAPNHDAALRTYETLGFFDTQFDDVDDISAAEVARQISAVGKVVATSELSIYESGVSSTIANPTTIRIAHNAIPSSRIGDMLYMKSGPNAGHHRIVGITRGTSLDLVMVDTLTPFVDTTVVDDNWEVVHEIVRLTSKNVTMATKITVVGGTAAATMGFSVGSTYGLTTGLQIVNGASPINLKISDVVAGDKATFDNIPGTGGPVVYTVNALSSSKQIELDTPLPTNPALSYSVLIESADVLEYKALMTAIVQWEQLLSTSPYNKFSADTLELDRVMNPLIYNKATSPAYLSAAINTANLLHSPSGTGILDVLATALIAFVVRVVARIDAALRMLQERGFDAAYDTVLDGDIVGFFAMDKDDASSASAMLKSARVVAQNDIPVSKAEEDVDDITHDPAPVISTDANYDYSDIDKDENANLVGQDATLDAGETSGSSIIGKRLDG